jgi:hypothetical protein
MALKQADILGPSPYPGEQADNWALNHPSPKGDWTDQAGVYDLKFVYNGQFHMSDKDDYEILARNAGMGPDYKGPLAIGKVHVDLGKAQWELSTNIHSKGIEGVLQTITAKQGWQWGGATDLQGQPLSESRVSSLYFSAIDGEIKFAHSKAALANPSGAIHMAGKNAYIYPYREEWLEALKEWADDTGRTLYAANDNTIKVVEDLEEKNVYSPDWLNEEDHFLGRDPEQGNDSTPIGPQECPHCKVLFPSMNALIEHRKNDVEPWPDPDNKEPAIEYNPTKLPNMDDQLPAKFHERDNLVYGATPIPAPIPFIYDIKHDVIELGQPGETKDSMGARFTPGGIVRGQFDPSGKLSIESTSDFQITISHLMDLWTWSFPQYTLKSIWLDNGDGSPEKVAKKDNIWSE